MQGKEDAATALADVEAALYCSRKKKVFLIKSICIGKVNLP